MAVTQKHRAFAVNTSLGEDVLLFWRMTATEQLGRLFEYELELLSERTDIALAEVLGKNVTVRMQLPEVRGSGTRYFNGFITRFSYQGTHGLHYGLYRATLSPWLWFLTRASDCRIFQNKTAPDIIETVFSDHGFTDFRRSLTGSYRTWEYCVQYRETDFNFVSRLMEQEGIYYYFEHENGKHTLVLADNLGAHVSFPSYSQVPYYPPDAQNFRKVDHIYQWVVEKQVQPGTYELNDFDFTAPRKNLRTVASMPEDHAMANFAMYDYPGEYSQTSDGDHYSTVRLQELLAQHEVLRGEGIARGLATGYLFDLTNCGREEQNRRYLVVAAVYELQSDSYKSVANLDIVGKPYVVRITAIDAQQIYRAPRSSRKPLVQGPQTAIVVGPSGDEIHTDQYGRVKCQFHWDRYGEANENSSCWIRVAQSWAGKKWGALYMPRVGQEVIVEFLEGDPDQPIITGRVYNGVNMPPYTLPNYKTMSTLKSLSSTGGGGFNELRFEDKKDEEQIFIHAQRRMDMRIRGSLYETNYGNREMRIGWEKDGERGGNCNTFVQFDVNYHVKEGEYQKIDKKFHQTIVEDVLESHTKNHTTFITEISALNAKKVIIEGADQVSAKSGKITIEGTQGVHIKAGQLNLEGQQGISLKVGGNFVVIDATGVYINGTMVNINSGGSANSADAAESVAQAEIEEPIDAAPADNAEPGQKSQVSATPRTRKKVTLKPQEVPPYQPPPPPPPPGGGPPPPPVPPLDVTKCAFISAKGKCEHGREISDGKTLEVVSAETYGSDEIQLEAELWNEGKCQHIEGCPFAEGPVKWTITDNGTKYGKTTSFPAKGPITSKFWLPSISPKKYDIRCSSCGGSKRLTVDCYPGNQFAAKLDLEKALKMLRTITDAAQWALEFAPGVEKFSWKYLEGKVSGEAQWKEWTDHRAYYAYKIAIGFDPLFGAEFKASLGSGAITKYVKKIPLAGKYIQRVIDWLVKAGLYIKLSGGINVDANYERKSPDEAKFMRNTGSGLSGKIQVTLGGEASAVGDDVIKVDINASAAIVGKGDFSLDDKGALVDLAVEFDGLKGQAVVAFLWGLVSFEDTITFVDKQTLWGPKKFYFWEN